MICYLSDRHLYFRWCFIPSCSNLALDRSAIDKTDEFVPKAAAALLNNFYVDDLLKSIKSAEDAVSNAVHTYATGGFQLTIFIGNHPVF